MFKKHIIFFMVAIVISLLGLASSAAVFDYMTYQGVLVQDGERVTGTKNLTFKIYNSQSGGTLKWDETRSSFYIENGILNIVLGEVNPMSDDLDGTEQYWLEIWVDGVQLGSRTKLCAVPYSINTKKLDGNDASSFASATHNHDGQYVNENQSNSITSTMIVDGTIQQSDMGFTAGDITAVNAGTGLSGGGSSGSVSLSLGSSYQSGSAYDGRFVNEGQSNSITSAMIASLAVGNSDLANNSVTSGKIQDGTIQQSDMGFTAGDITAVNAGTGLSGGGSSGSVSLSLGSSYQSGSAYDGRFVNEGQSNSITSGMISPNILSSLDGVANDGNNIDLVEGSNITITPNDVANTITISSTGGGIACSDCDGRFVNEGQSNSITSGMISPGNLVSGSNSTYIIKAENNGSGYGISASAHGVDACGVYASADANDGKAIYGYGGSDNNYAIYGNGSSRFVKYSGIMPVVDVVAVPTGQTCGIRIEAPNTTSSFTDGLIVVTKYGTAINAYKTYNDDDWVATIQSWSENQKSLYVRGNFLVEDGTKSAAVKTSTGYEAVFCVESPEVEFYSNGTAKLNNGTASVAFDRLFSETISPDVPVRVTITPVGSWSGIYLENATNSGFTVISETGDLDATFNWIAIGRRKGYEERPDIEIPGFEEMDRIRQQKEAMLRLE